MKKVLISIMLLVSFVIFTGCDQTEVNDMDYDELDFTNEAIECTVKEVCIMNENGSNEDAFHCIADSEDPLRTDGKIYELEGVTPDFKKKYHNQKKSITEKVRAKFSRIAKSSRFAKSIQNAMAREIRRSEVRLNVSNFRLSKNKLELTNESIWSLTEDAGNIENAESFDSDAARANLEENASRTDVSIVLVIQVTANDSEPTSSPATISDTVFGTNGKSLNMASQFATCSFDMKTIFPADGPHIVDGVLQVAIDQNVLGTDGGRIFRNAAIAAANEKLGFSVKSQFDNVMIVCPPGIKSGWAGYAYVNGNLSVYKDNFINNIHVIMHEVGHNFGLLHSGEGSLNYGDHTGYMGTAYGKEYCYNGAKSSELGWYSDREYVISDSWTGNLVGVVDYAKASGDEQVLLKVKGATEDDIHIAFNRKKGFNKGTMEAGDQITVTKRSSKPGSAQSWLLAKLDKGADYKVNDFGGSNNHLYIRVDDIVYGSNVDYATVSVNFGQELVAVTVNSGTGSGNYATGTTVTITANTAPKGQEFDKWVVNSGGAVIANTNESSTPLKLGASDATVTATYKTSSTGGPAGYIWCANENGSYTFNQTVDVAYGANGKFVYKKGVTGKITFNNGTFGDPIPGVRKVGYYKVNELSHDVAQGKSTSQSSIGAGGSSSRAVDGNTSGAWNAKSTTHTNSDNEAWWKVDLGGAHQVNKVTLWNRTDCCGNRLSDFHVDLLDIDGNVIASEDHSGTAGVTTDINVSADGVSSVRVQLYGKNYLSLAEVQVFGY